MTYDLAFWLFLCAFCGLAYAMFCAWEDHRQSHIDYPEERKRWRN